MTDTSARGRIEFHILWCRDCISLIRSRFHVILKFSFHHSSTKFPFNRVSNQNWFLRHDHARLTRLVLRRATCSRINPFASTSLGAAKVRAAAISIPGFADQEQENKTRGLQEPQGAIHSTKFSEISVQNSHEGTQIA